MVEGISRLIQEQIAARDRSLAPEPLWSVQDVAAYLSVSRRTVETLVAAGELRPLWIGGSRRFTPDAVRAYLAGCTRRS